MLRYNRLQSIAPLLLLAAVDCSLLLASFFIGLEVSWVELDAFWPDVLVYLPHALFYTLVIWSMMFAVGLYHARYFATLADVAVRLSVVITLSLFIFSIVFYLWPSVIIWRSIMSPALVVAFGAIVVTRVVARKTLSTKALRRRVLVMGVGKKAEAIAELERTGQAFGFTCVGYYEIPKELKRVPAGCIVDQEEPLIRVVERLKPDEIVLAADDRRGRLPLEALWECRRQNVSVIDYLTFYERETGSVDLDALQLDWFLFSPGFSNSWLHKALKRLLDLCVCLCLLALFLPLIVATAILIRLESPGPVIFRQTRVGSNGRSFTLFKFRSMAVASESDGTPLWAAANDPRVTRVGAVIRKLRIDELPQIFNVLKGDMSFVGPRPERPFFVQQLTQEIPYYLERHRVKPGITGWAQVNYRYGSSIEDARIKHRYDLYYLKHGSFLLDVLIILQTIRVVLWPEGVR